MVGASVGTVGDSVGDAVGLVDGNALGLALGIVVGASVGRLLGLVDGFHVGIRTVGDVVRGPAPSSVGAAVGTAPASPIVGLPVSVGASVVSSPSSATIGPTRNRSPFGVAPAWLLSALNATVASWPHSARIGAVPPGWFPGRIHPVTLYAKPAMTIQQSSDPACAATSSGVMPPPPASSAGASPAAHSGSLATSPHATVVPSSVSVQNAVGVQILPVGQSAAVLHATHAA